jgi:hypothetical protein
VAEKFPNLTKIERNVLEILHNKKYKNLLVGELEEIQRLYSKDANPKHVSHLVRWNEQPAELIKKMYYAKHKQLHELT